MGDVHRFRQILVNVVGNAIKFTERGRVGVALDWRPSRQDAARYAVWLRVDDSGIGIPVDVQERLFKPFEQADSSTTRRYGGTGLGLAITRRLVELMGGTIRLESEPGRGTTIEVELPLPRAAATARAAQRAAAAPAAPRGGKLNVLLVEDNPVNQLLAQAMLQTLPADVTLAETGSAAVERATRQSFDLVLMDWQLPDLDGLEAIRRIRDWESTQARGHVPIVMVTANAMTGDKEQCLQAGADDYLSKPFRAKDLKDLIERLSLRAA